MTPIDFQRSRFEQIKAMFGNNEDYRPQKSQLCFVEPFRKGRGNYQFKVDDVGLTNPHVIARHLSRDDMFVAKSLFVGIYIEPTDKPGHGIIITYPMQHSVGVPEGYSGLTNPDGEALYNGELQLLTGQVLNYDSFPLHAFRVVPETQPVPIMGDSGFVSAGVLPEFNFEKAAIDLPEIVTFRGDGSQKISINFPVLEDSEIKAEADFTAYLIVKVDGWKIQNGASYKRLG